MDLEVTLGRNWYGGSSAGDRRMPALDRRIAFTLVFASVIAFHVLSGLRLQCLGNFGISFHVASFPVSHPYR